MPATPTHPLDYAAAMRKPRRLDLALAASGVLVAVAIGAGPLFYWINRMTYALPWGLGRFVYLLPWVYVAIATCFIRNRRLALLALVLVFLVCVTAGTANKVYFTYMARSMISSYKRYPFVLSSYPLGSMLLDAVRIHAIPCLACVLWTFIHPPVFREQATPTHP